MNHQIISCYLKFANVIRVLIIYKQNKFNKSKVGLYLRLGFKNSILNIRRKKKFIQQLIRDDASNVELILKPPEQQDEGVWKYEHVRQFCMDLNLITVRLQDECSPAVCTQMTATEQWIFLCAAHKNPKEVYILLILSN